MADNGDVTGVIILGDHVQALGTARSLGRRKIPVYLANPEPLCIARFSKYVKKFFVCPSFEEDFFINFLLDLVDAEKVSGWVLIPNNDAVVSALSRNKRLLEKYYKVPTPSWETTRFAYDKKLTYSLAEKQGIPIPQTFYPTSLDDLLEKSPNMEFPVIVKPAVMHSFYKKTKKKAIKAETADELVAAYKIAARVINTSEIIVQEVIPGRPGFLYSFCSFFKNGEPKGHIVGRRLRQRPMDFGRGTTFAVSESAPSIVEYSIKLLKSMNYYGASEVEFKKDPRDGVFKLLEVNPRTWLWHSLASRCGVDIPYLLYQDIAKGEVTPIDDFRLNVKWLHFYTDISVATEEILGGRMKIKDYVNSLRGEKELAVFSKDDPLPFIAETIMLPYLWMVR